MEKSNQNKTKKHEHIHNEHMHNGHMHHEHDHYDMEKDLKNKLIISLILTIPILFLSQMIQEFIGLNFTFYGDKYVSLFLASIVYFYCSMPFFKGFISEITNKKPGMMTLITLGISIAYFYSFATVFGLSGEIFLWELVTLIDVMLLGHLIEMRSVRAAGKSVEKLAELIPAFAHLMLPDGKLKDVKINEIKVGDKVFVKSGEKIPVDGVILEGISEINDAALTGESKLQSKTEGEKVLGGAINVSGTLTIEVKKTGEDSYIAGVIQIVKNALASKSQAQNLADKSAFILTIIAILAGGITFLVWFTLGELAFALERTVAVMVITCPHALGLAVPLVVSGILTMASKRSLLIRNRIAFENAHKINVIVFDKTGTLTKGNPEVSDIVAIKEFQSDDILRYAASLELKAKHVIAGAVVDEAEKRKIKLVQVQKFKQIPGKGILGTISDQDFFVGNERILDEFKFDEVEVNASLEKAKFEMQKIAEEGKTVIFVGNKKGILGLIVLEDAIRNESFEAITKLKKLGYEIAMITGDNKAIAKRVCKTLGIDICLAEILPAQKAQKIKELQQQGKKVAMVGDGINDAPALAEADLGIAIGAGTEIAIETADVVLVKSDPRDVLDVFGISRLEKRKLIQNIAWATGYNIVALPLAAGVLFKYGILPRPEIGAIFMTLSTVIVTINSKLLFYKRSDL